MVIFSGLFAVLSRLVGAVATRTLGWATVLLFGRVPQSKQRLLSFMALASIAWLVCVVAVVSPIVDRLIVSAIPRPGFVSGSWITFALLVGAVLLPAAVGLATMALSPEDDHREPSERVGAILRGYPYTAVLAATIVFLAAWAVVRNIRSMRRGWESVHIPMIVKPGRYEEVVGDIAGALAGAGLDVERREASRWFVVPPRVLARVGGRRVGGLVPDRLIGFEADDLAILVYPSDVAILGRSTLVAPARSAVARRLAFAEAYLTSAKESEQVEDRLRELTQRSSVVPSDFDAIDVVLASLALPYDEWETLLRLRLQVEREAVVVRRLVGLRAG